MYMIWYESRDMYVFVRCKCSVRRMDAGEDSLESRQESCCGRLDDESTISKRVMERRQAAAGELAGMLVCWYATVMMVVGARRRRTGQDGTYYCASAVDEMVVCVRWSRLAVEFV
jgi:hypothetical protein